MVETAEARRGGRGRTPTRSTCCSRSATTSRASACARSATPARCRCARILKHFREEFDEHVRQGGCTCPDVEPVGSLLPEPEAPAAAGARLMSATEIDTVTLDGRRPRGARAEGHAARRGRGRDGVEIPVFCYEPRLGPPVGACRMCLVEVEGDAEAAGRLHDDGGRRHDGAQRGNERASDAGKDAVLEFLLINHPLDCPVCDKGGECPLQDLTFRYGPGNTRFVLPKRTYEKPLPVSPLIVLDRERCILCYRCTRFSSDVAEDERADRARARRRGRDRHVRGAPVRRRVLGQRDRALPGRRAACRRPTASRRGRGRSTTSRRSAALLPDRLQHLGDGARGPGRSACCRATSPSVDEGWLCDKGRFALDHVRADRPLREPARAGRVAGSTRRRGRPRPRPSRAALRHYANLHGPARSPWSHPASRRTRRPSPGARSRRPPAAARSWAAAGAWELLDPYARDDRRPRRGRRDRGRRRRASVATAPA